MLLVNVQKLTLCLMGNFACFLSSADLFFIDCRIFFQGRIPEQEMAKTFNCGIGGVLIVEKSIANQIVEQLRSSGEEATLIGHVEKQIGELIVGLVVY